MLKCQAIDLGSSIPAGAYGGCRIHRLALAVWNLMKVVKTCVFE